MSKQKRTELSTILSRNAFYFRQIFFLTCFVALLPITPILYMRTVFGPVVNSGSESFLLWVTLLLIIMLSLAGVLEYFRGKILFAFCTAVTSNLETRIFDSTFANTSKVNYQSGSTVLNCLRKLRIFILSPVMGAILDAPISSIFIVIIFFIHPLMGILAISGALLMLLIAYVTQKKIEPIYNKATEAMQKVRGNLAETFRNAEAAYVSGVSKNNLTAWKNNQREYLTNQALASNDQTSFSSATKIIMLIQGSLILGLGTFLSLTGVMDIRNVGNIIIAKFIGMLALRPFIVVIMGWKNVIEARNSYKQLEVFLENFKVPDPTMNLPKAQGKLNVKKLVYNSDENNRLILDDLSFNIDPGSFLCVIGYSGSGKTTLARLLVGYQAPTKGEVRLDGVEISTWSKEDLADNIGYLPQNFDLFKGTISENITRFNEPNTIDLENSVKRANLEPLLNKLDDGIRTVIDPDQLQFSRGELQKIAIARAFYGAPKYIVLDEPTSNLDEPSELHIIDSIKELNELGATIIVMTHTKKIVEKAEFILGLTEGRQKMFGSKEDLKKKLLPNKND